MRLVLPMLLMLGLGGCIIDATREQPAPREFPTLAERKACQAQAKKENRSHTYCWANQKPEGATR